MGSPGNGPTSPVVARWQLAETLRQLREKAGLTHDEVIGRVSTTSNKWSKSKLSRIENQAQGVRSGEVGQLLDVYDVTDQDLREWLTGLATAARESGRASPLHRNFPAFFQRFAGWESTLVAYRQFETLLVPGLLQTAEYAHALIAGIYPGLADEEVHRRVAARIARQQIFARSNPPDLHFILDAGILERPIGSPHVTKSQLLRIAELADRPHITIQVLPKSSGATPGLEGPFSILTLPDQIPDIGFTECPTRSIYIEDRDDVRIYTLRFGILTEQALSSHETVTVLREAAESYHSSNEEGSP